MSLKDYKAKREFGKTPEPNPETLSGGDRLFFVIHKHAARALHYDLRLELGGVLKSWAVPKGPSLEPSLKRLAVMVEDHPFEYKEFEGIIPQGNYGAGSVIIWDRGFYHHPSTQDKKESEKLLLQGLRKGDLKFVLEGEKLRGEFALMKTGKDEKSWLLMKKRDRYASAVDILKENRSVASGRTLEELYGTGQERPSPEKISQVRLREAVERDDLSDAVVKPMPRGLRPMLATLVKKPFDHPGWIFEVKWDGYRALAEIRGNEVSLFSRNRVLLNKKFSPVVKALQKCGFDAVLDGEIVVVDGQGRPDFQMLQDYQKTGKGHLLYYLFDLLYFRGHDLTNLPLLRRKEILKNILPPAPELKFSDHVTGEGVLFFETVREKGLEGIMAKDAQSTYQSSRRSKQWLKVKTRLTQEAVIAGFTEPGGSRSYFGSLVLGVYDAEELIYIGHSGGGFPTKTLKELREKMDPLVQKRCPFKERSPGCHEEATWLKPKLVCEVSFQGWTAEGVLRQPVFLRMREDKDAKSVIREKPE